MPPISFKTKERISEQILAHLFSKSPEPKFTSHIARDLARDEEFIKSLLIELEKRKFVVRVVKNSQGADFLKRQRWRLSNAAFEAYSRMQR